MSNDEIYRLCLADLSRVNTIFSEILAKKQVTEAEQKRIDYCVKIVNDVTEKQLHLNNRTEE